MKKFLHVLLSLCFATMVPTLEIFGKHSTLAQVSFGHEMANRLILRSITHSRMSLGSACPDGDGSDKGLFMPRQVRGFVQLFIQTSLQKLLTY